MKGFKKIAYCAGLCLARVFIVAAVPVWIVPYMIYISRKKNYGKIGRKNVGGTEEKAVKS